jgi:hypothetical protein
VSRGTPETGRPSPTDGSGSTRLNDVVAGIIVVGEVKRSHGIDLERQRRECVEAS